jgi:hypothetical protein
MSFHFVPLVGWRRRVLVFGLLFPLIMRSRRKSLSVVLERCRGRSNHILDIGHPIHYRIDIVQSVPA